MKLRWNKDYLVTNGPQPAKLYRQQRGDTFSKARWLCVALTHMYARIHTPMMRRKTLNPARPWYPSALRWPSLVAATVTTWVLMAVLGYFAHQSTIHGGVLFAPEINDIPLRRAFAYRYAPTLVAVLFGVCLVWIDHDAKRFEPYRQMARQERGASARDSLLVAYPFEFAPFAPFVAARRG